jgi:hypothetical protein
MKFIRILLTLIFGPIYVALNSGLMSIQKWFFPLWETDKIMYFLFLPFYWIYVGIVFLVSIPYEFLIAVDLH